MDSGSGISHTVSEVVVKSLVSGVSVQRPTFLAKPDSIRSRAGIRPHFMSDCGSEILVAQIFQPPSDVRHMRKPKGGAGRALTEGRRNLESGHVQGYARAEGFEQCFLDRPEMVELAQLSISVRGCELPLFPRTEDAAYQSIEFAAGDALLDIHAQPPGRSQGDQSMTAAVADVEVDGRRGPANEGKRFSMPGGSEGQLPVPAAELSAEKGAERSPAQGEPAAGACKPVALTTRLFLPVKACQSLRFAGSMRRQVDVGDRGIADFPERTPPALGNGTRHRWGLPHGNGGFPTGRVGRVESRR